MNNLIGITGGMSSGKTTLAKKIMENNNNFIYIDVDDFRRSLYKKIEYVERLKDAIKDLKQYDKIDSKILNKYIYNSRDNMLNYKKLLYEYLFNYINGFDNKTILVDWALIINDNLIDKFNKIIYLNVSEDTRLKRLSNSDLTHDEIIKRFELQRIDDIEKYRRSNFMIVGEEINMEAINDFIKNMECKFTLPKDEGKAIWEITHSCNYGCSYCIFSCDKKKVQGELTKE